MFLKSSELENFNGENCLRIYLDSKFPYTVKHDGQELEALDFLFKEPTMADMAVLRKLAISLEKLNSYENVKTIRIANLFSRNTYEAIKEDKERQEVEDVENQTIIQEIEEEAKEEKSMVDEVRLFLTKVFGFSSDFEDENTDYFVELSKFIEFVNLKCFREGSGSLFIPTSLSVLDKYKADAFFLKEEIVVEYLSFFFDHLPSKSLHMAIKG